MSNLIPENIYRVRATDNWTLSETSKGTPYARLEFVIQEGPHKGYRLSKDFYMSDKTWEKTVESLRACGWDNDDPGNLKSCTNNVVVAKFVHEAMEDKAGNPLTDQDGHVRMRMAIAWVGVDRGPKPMEQGKLTSFRELMKARLQQQREAAGGIGAPAPASDDLQF